MPFSCAGFERTGDLLRDPKRVLNRQRPAGHALCERVAFDQLENQKSRALDFFQPVDGRNVRIVQRCEDLSFPLEPRGAFGIGCKKLG